MARRSALIWCGVLTMAAVLCYFFPLLHIRSISDASNQDQSSLQLPASIAAPINLTDFVDEFWDVQLNDVKGKAIDIRTLFAAFEGDPQQARSEFGHQIGLGGDCFFFVRGTGEVERLKDDQCILRIGEQSRRACLALGVIVGNAVRDSTGLIDVNQFANSQDFNNLSVELNRRVEVFVVGPARKQLRVGSRVSFVGCAEIGDDGDLDPFCLVPVRLDVLDSGAQP